MPHPRQIPDAKSSPADVASEHSAHVSHFGVLKAGPTILTVKANFPGSSLNARRWEETTAVGDVIIKFARSAGSYDAVVEISYHSE